MSLTPAQIETFKSGFTLASGSSAEGTVSDIKRKMLAVYIKGASDTAYEMLGYKQESMSVASNYDTADTTDVTGATYTDINSKAEKIEMSEYHINKNKTKFLEEAIKNKIFNQEEKMQNYTVLTVYGFLRDTDGNCLATEETGCTVVLDNLGGQGFVMSDVNITLSGVKTYGTVPEIVATPTFTEASAKS